MATGDDALRLAAQEQPTHILIELDLPDMSGMVVLHQMRQNLPFTRIIATNWYGSRRIYPQAQIAR
jgi:DNA-binding response OmpR family regulator